MLCCLSVSPCSACSVSPCSACSVLPCSACSDVLRIFLLLHSYCQLSPNLSKRKKRKLKTKQQHTSTCRLTNKPWTERQFLKHTTKLPCERASSNSSTIVVQYDKYQYRVVHNHHPAPSWWHHGNRLYCD